MIKKILSVLAILMLIGTAFGAVNFTYNKIASANVEVTSETEIESMIWNGSEFIPEIYSDINSGELVLNFRYTNKDSVSKNGMIIYTIICEDGLVFDNGSIIDFDSILYDNNTEVNTNEYITKVNNNTAIITIPTEIFESEISKFKYINFIFNSKAYGSYKIYSEVTEIIVDPTPTEEPTETPTEEPTEIPTEEPTEIPTEEPTPDPSSTTPCMLIDVESGVNSNSDIGGALGFFMKRGAWPQEPLDIYSPGANGTNYCLIDNSSTDFTDNTFYIDSQANRSLIEEADDANRFSFYIKLPVGFDYAPDSNLHFGTYTRDPTIPSNVQGWHYYHFYNLKGSEYWTKVIANEHPRNLVSSQSNIIDNPTLPNGWNYYDGFTRFYFEILVNNNMTEEYDWYLDETLFYHEEEQENTVSINSLACSYFGNGQFDIGWSGENRTNNFNHYELRYSNEPITNANYDSALIAPGCDDVTMVIGRGVYSFVKADFVIPVTEGTVHFAIKDLTSGNPYCTRISYTIHEPPVEPTNKSGYVSTMLCDFEDGINSDNDPTSDGYFRMDNSYDPLAIENIGAIGTNYSVHFDADPVDSQQQTFYLAHPSNKEHIEENDGCNRMEFYVKIPVGIETVKSYNFHIGTYVQPGTGNLYTDGPHYYHYTNIEGSEYWTKIIMNEHPQHWCSSKESVIDNPTYPEFNYMEGLNRFYISILANSQTNIPDPWSWNIDEVRFYNELEPENTDTINTLCCIYHGEGHYIVRWNCGERTGCGNHYELRYSDEPITNDNYDQAQIAPGCEDLTRMVTEHGTAYAVISADFTIPIDEGTAYFAVKDTSINNPYCTCIDYTIYEL